MNKREATRATTDGAIVACVTAVLTFTVVLYAMNSDANGALAYWNDPSVFFDIGLSLVLAFLIYRKSRVSAILMFAYFITSKAMIFVEMRTLSGLVVALVFLYFFAKAIQGSFVYHKLEKEENPDYKAASKWAYIMGTPASFILLALLGYALMSVTGVVPSTRVQTGSELATGHLATLRRHSIISDDENVEYFYSPGLLSILESGNVLTQKRLITYSTDEDDALNVHHLSRDEITDVVLELQGGQFSDSVYKINTKDPERWLELVLSVELKGDRKFVRNLRNRLVR